MNRDQGLLDLVNEIRENAPKGLDTSVQRAMAKNRKHRRAVNMIRIPAAAVVALVLSFALLVNTSAAFARTVGEVPALRELAKLVAQDPSLRAAVENKYVQPIGQAVTHDDVTVNIGYAIADEQRLSVFLDIQGETAGVRYGVDRIGLSTMDGTEISAMMSWGFPETGLQEARFDLADGERLPADVRIAIRLCLLPHTEQNGLLPPEPVEDSALSLPEANEALPSEWDFDLHLDPALIAQGEVHPIDQWVEIAGQRLRLDSLTIYPSQAKLKLETDPGNTAFISGLDVWIKDDRGEVWTGRKNGVSGTFDPDSIEKRDIWLESSYFSASGHLTLHIGRAALIPKDMADVTVDYAAGTVKPLPDFVKLISMTPMGGKLRLSFAVTYGKDDPSFNPFYSLYHNADGKELSISVSSFNPGEDGTGTCEFEVEDYQSPVTLKLISVPMEEIEPIEIGIK